MVMIFGEVSCPGCNIKTRFAEEVEMASSETLLLLGSVVRGNGNRVYESQGLAPCDYCEKEFTVYMQIVDEVVAGFSSEVENLPTKPVVIGAGIKNEKEKKIAQFNETWKMPFEEQPKLSGYMIKAKQGKWKVLESYKKENIEPDITIRTSSDVTDEYWYKVTNGKDIKWISVIDSNEDNAKISIEPPVIKENEMLHEVEDASCKSEILFVKETEDYMILTGIQMLSGTMLLLHSKDEDGSTELEANIFASNLQEALVQLERMYAQH